MATIRSRLKKDPSMQIKCKAGGKLVIKKDTVPYMFRLLTIEDGRANVLYLNPKEAMRIYDFLGKCLQ